MCASDDKYITLKIMLMISEAIIMGKPSKYELILSQAVGFYFNFGSNGY